MTETRNEIKLHVLFGALAVGFLMLALFPSRYKYYQLLI